MQSAFIFFLHEEYISIFLIQSAGNKFLLFLACLRKSSFFLHFLKGISLGTELLANRYFSFNTLKMLLHHHLACIVSDKKCTVILCSSVCSVPFSLVIFKTLSFVFSSFIMICLDVYIWGKGWYLGAGGVCVFSETLGSWFGLCHSFWKILSHYVFKCFFWILFSPFWILITRMLEYLTLSNSSWM